jgi:hypothetical protein
MVAELQIEKLTERERYVNALVYGESGTGKTTWASSAPKPILWLESEGGTSSIAPEDMAGIDVAKVTGLETYRQALALLQKGDHGYKTVVLDSFTETAAAILKQIMRAAVQADASRDEFSPLFSEWGRLTGVMREIARGFRDLPMHTIITALQREDTDELSGRVKVRPRMSPTLADELPGFMDVVGYLYVKGDIVDAKAAKAAEEGDEAPKVERIMLLRPTIKHVAKLRAPKGSNPPDYLINSEFEDVQALLHPSN